MDHAAGLRGWAGGAGFAGTTPLQRGGEPPAQYWCIPGTWALTGSLVAGRNQTTATLLPDGTVLVAGGYGVIDGTEGPLATAEIYNPTTGTFTATGSLSDARYGHTATLLHSGQVLIAGGNGLGAQLTSAELYDPATGTFTPTGRMVQARALHTATLLPSGQVLVAGGTNGPGAYAELYNPGTGTWTPTSNMNEGRYLHTATLLADGRVLVAGGYVLDPGLSGSTELYDPASGTWSFSGFMNAARAIHTATLLPNGQVLVTGGYDILSFADLSSAELYDPTRGAWQYTGIMTSARVYHTAMALPGGQVLVAGGSADSGVTSLASAELYDPATGTFTPTGSLSLALENQAVVLLADGRALALGGNNQQSGFVLPAEVYTVPLGAQLAASPRRLAVSQTLALTGTAFAPAEPITLALDCTCAAPLTTTVAGPGGGFVTTLPLPPAVNGLHTLIAQGASSGRLASITVSVRPVVGLVPHVGAAGTSVTVSGTGFGASEPVALHWNGASGPTLGTARSSTRGGFGGTSALHITIPASRLGWHALVAVGQDSGAQAVALFHVTAP